MSASRTVFGASFLALLACDPKPHPGDSSGPEPRDTSPGETGGESAPDSEHGDSEGHESTPPPDSEGDTEALVDTADTAGGEPWGEVFSCGGWSTGPAPVGRIRLREADAILMYAEGGYDNGLIADSDGDGCGELLVVIGQDLADNDVAMVPGTLVGELPVVDTSAAIVRGLDYHGLSPTAIGDLDGDGRANDWMLGATASLSYDVDGFTGAVYMYSSPLAGEYTEAGADATVWPPSDSTRFADDISVGDMDDDGVDDLAVGWAQSTDYCRVLAMSGPLVGEVSSSGSTASFEYSGSDCGAFGQYLTMESDLNADGLKDLSPTAFALSSFQGGLYVYYAPFSGNYQAEDADAFLAGEAAWSNTGMGIAGGADANQDGYEDLLVAAPCAGMVYLVLGPVAEGETLTHASEAVLSGGAELGLDSVSLGQDMDADGFPDPAFGDQTYHLSSGDMWGAVFLFYGPMSGHLDVLEADAIFYEDDHDFTSFYSSMLAGGDTDGDGFDDLLITSTWHPSLLFRGGLR